MHKQNALFPRAALAAALVLLVAAGAPAQSLTTLAPDCRAPQAPDVPDGTTANEDELVAAQQRLKAFLADGDEYLKCLQNAEAALGDTIMPEQQQVLLGAYNSMVDTMQYAGTRFNEAVRAFKAR